MKDDLEPTEEDYTTIGKYLNGTLSPEEKTRFEEKVTSDPRLAQQLHSLEEIWKIAPQSTLPIQTDPASALTAVHQKIEKIRTGNSETKKPRINFTLRIAAAIALVLVSTLVLWFKNPAVIEIDSSVLNHQLPDGTLVYLAEGATLKYPKKFNRNYREVTLEGKSYFDVEPNPELPFIIHGTGSKVTVLGTEFEMSTDSLQTSVSVTEGKVVLSSSSNEETKVILSAGESAVIDFLRSTVVEEKAASPLAGTWATGKLIFNQVPLAKLVSSLNAYFDSKILLEGTNLDGCEITTRFDHPELSEVIEELSLLLSLEVKNDDTKIILSGQGCKNE
ncbi:MAG: FecR domain-containing protein [Saprospiraceae bacterium]|nr:FecR domain-containing protein [Saprospiraceae bacterium]